MRDGDEIDDVNAVFYRRIYRSDKKYLDKTGRPTSRAFSPRPKDDGQLSVDLSSLSTPQDSCGDVVRFTLFSILGKTVKSTDLKIIYNPISFIQDGKEKTNIAHSIIIGFEKDDESKPGILARSSICVL